MPATRNNFTDRPGLWLPPLLALLLAVPLQAAPARLQPTPPNGHLANLSATITVTRKHHFLRFTCGTNRFNQVFINGRPTRPVEPGILGAWVALAPGRNVITVTGLTDQRTTLLDCATITYDTDLDSDYLPLGDADQDGVPNDLDKSPDNADWSDDSDGNGILDRPNPDGTKGAEQSVVITFPLDGQVFQ